MSHLVDILLATYNGESYLQEQMDSLLEQTFTDWHLLVRDDGSTDKTMLILEGYRKAYPLKITILNDSQGRLGPAKSFAYLAEQSSAAYIAFCDQDDIWLQEKLLVQVAAMQESEKEYGKLLPILLHSDLYVIDNNQKIIDDSFWHYQNLKPQVMNKLERLLAQNSVTGCTVLINRALVALAFPVPENAIMHDWWLALMAVSEGRVIDLSEKTVKYRQHENNDIGAKKWSVLFVLRTAINDQKMMKSKLIKTRDQAAALLESGKLNAGSKEVTSHFVELFKRNWIGRRLVLIRMGFFKYGLVRNFGMFLLI